MEQNLTQNLDNMLIYWEKQGKTNLCGLHLINNLLQSPNFDKNMLDEISSELDKQEKLLLGDSNINEKYNNSSKDGNYNIQVISKALEIYEIGFKQLKTEEIISNFFENKEVTLITNQAFIINSKSHWLCLRKVNNVWFNLNSANDNPGPQIITENLFDSVVSDILDYNLSIFEITNLHESAIYFDTKDIPNKEFAANYVKYSVIKNTEVITINLKDCDEMEIERAIRDSYQNPQQTNPPTNDTNQRQTNTNSNLNRNDIVQNDEIYNQDKKKKNKEDEVLDRYSDYFLELKNSLAPEPKSNSQEPIIFVYIKYGQKAVSRTFLVSDKFDKIENFARLEFLIVPSIRFKIKIGNSIVQNVEEQIELINKNLNQNQKILNVEIIC